MKVFISLIVITSYIHAQDWYEQTIREEGAYFYYVGMSSPKATRKEALEDAYAEALKEAVRHNFGLVQNFMGEYEQTEEKVNISQKTILYRSGVKFVGAVPERKYIVEEDDNFTAYQEVKYPKVEIEKEKQRLKFQTEYQYEIKPTLDKSKNKSLKKKPKKEVVKEKDYADFAFIYVPGSFNEEEADFINLPIRMEFYPYRYLSFGISYFYDSDEESENYDSTTSDKTYYEHEQDIITTETSEFVLDLKIYPIRTRWFSLGIGKEYSRYVMTQTQGDYEDNIIKEEEIEGYGNCASLNINLSPINQSSGKSIYIDYRENSRAKTYSLGFAFNF